MQVVLGVFSVDKTNFQHITVFNNEDYEITLPYNKIPAAIKEKFCPTVCLVVLAQCILGRTFQEVVKCVERYKVLLHYFLPFVAAVITEIRQIRLHNWRKSRRKDLK